MSQIPNQNAGKIVHCDRCHARCRVRDTRNGDAQIGMAADGTRGGHCPTCSITQFLKTSVIAETVMLAVEEHGVGLFQMPHIQEQIGRILSVGKADMFVDEIDWHELMANWDLPVEKGKGGRLWS